MVWSLYDLQRGYEEANMDPISIISAAAGVIGTAISVLSFKQTVSGQTPKLNVIPVPGWTTPQLIPCVCVEVVNLSSFPVTISEIGLNCHSGRRYVAIGFLTNGSQLPQRVEPRASLTAYFLAADVDINLVTTAFAKTSCGHVQEGDSPAWRQLRNAA